MPNNGLCSYLFDPDQRIGVTDAWAADHKALGADWVRVVVKADAHNHLDLGAYIPALNAYKRAGLKVCVLLDLDFNRPWLGGNPSRQFYPDEELGYKGNPRQNRWIRDTVQLAARTAAYLEAFVDAWILGNEPNLQAEIHPGQNVPPANSDKAPAMAPEVFYSFGWEVATALKALVPKPVYLGALSWLPTAGMHQDNPYCAGYVRQGLAYLRSTGAHTTPWDAVCVNAEGWWTLPLARRMQAAMQTALADFHVFLPDGKTPLPLVLSEWGQKASALPGHEDQARETLAALRAVSILQFFFEYPARVAHAVTDYAARDWTVGDGGFYPFGPPLEWWTLLHEQFTAAG